MSAKEAQKAAVAAKKAEHAADLAMGLNATMAKVIKSDTLLCTQCGASQLGPIVCECKGGRQKPGAGYCCKRQLLDAALTRQAAGKSAVLKDSAKKQGSVASARAKKKEAKGDVDLSEELQGDGTELTIVVAFPIGKLGMSLERNCVCNVSGDPAEHLGVKKGWVLFSVNGAEVPKKKEAIAKQIAQVFKERKTGDVDFSFRIPVTTEGFYHCIECDKFIKEDDFNASQLDKGPGKQMCYPCEEYKDMF